MANITDDLSLMAVDQESHSNNELDDDSLFKVEEYEEFEEFEEFEVEEKVCVGVSSKELTESLGQWKPSLMGYMNATDKVSEKIKVKRKIK